MRRLHAGYSLRLEAVHGCFEIRAKLAFISFYRVRQERRGVGKRTAENKNWPTIGVSGESGFYILTRNIFSFQRGTCH